MFSLGILNIVLILPNDVRENSYAYFTFIFLVCNLPDMFLHCRIICAGASRSKTCGASRSCSTGCGKAARGTCP